MRYVFFVLLFALVFSGSVAGGYYYFFLIPEKVERIIVQSLNDLGFEYLAYETVKKRRGRVIISNISLDEKGFSTIEEISVHFSLSHIFFESDQAQSIHIKNMRLTGDVRDGSGIYFAGWADHRVLIRNLAHLPTQNIVIENGVADLMSERFGGLKVKYDLQLNRTSPKSFEIVGRLSTRQNPLSFHSKVTGTINTDHDSNYKFDVEQLSLTLPDLKIRRGTAKVDFFYTENPTFYADVHLASLTHFGMPLGDVRGSVKTTQKGFSVAFKGGTFGPENIRWEADLFKDGGLLKSRVRLMPRHLSDLAVFVERSLSLKVQSVMPNILKLFYTPVIEIHMQSEKEKMEGQFKIILFEDTPSIVGALSSEDGRNTILGSLDEKIILSDPRQGLDFDLDLDGYFVLHDLFRGGGMEMDIKSEISGGVIDYGSLALKNLTGTLRFDSARPALENAPLAFSLPLKDHIAQKGRIDVNVKDSSRPLFGTAFLNIYGGKIAAEQPLLKNGALLKENRLVVSHLNLSQLLKDIGFTEIFVSGTVGGVIPVKFEETVMHVNGGILQSEEPGVIKLPSYTALSLFPGDTKDMIMKRRALANFSYEFFEIRLDGDLAGRALMTFSARGKNEEIGQKDPVDINIQLETQISTLFERLVAQDLPK